MNARRTPFFFLALLLLLLFNCNNASKAYGQDFQNLLNNNAEWYYEIKPFIGCLPCVVGFQHIKAVRDTLINNQVCVILEKSNSGDIDICDNMGTTLEYLYADEQKVYWFNEHLDDFTILYDFAAETGGSWEIQVLDCTLLVTVDSTSTIIINSQERKILYISDENNFFTGGVIEGIGHTRNMFPSDFFYNCQGVACDSDFIDGLRCYLENEVILYKPAIADCDEVYPVSIKEINFSFDWKICPNPVTNSFSFSCNNGLFQKNEVDFIITNLLGEIVLTGTINIQDTINVSSLMSGFYIVTVQEKKNSIIFYSKFLKLN
ncbi:MAG: T9SS type A sorting domain-containing protein [Bacteroidales bacterium]|nr:T9SS type A sorting domain-containing protein [Bacteroidales bacterium]